MTRKRQIPPVERVTDPAARQALSAMAERLKDLDGITGPNGTSAATKQDLVDAGLVEIDKSGNLSKKAEDEQVPIKDQSLLSLESSLTPITTPDIAAAQVSYSQVQMQLVIDGVNENKAKINEAIAEIRTGLFKQ